VLDVPLSEGLGTAKITLTIKAFWIKHDNVPITSAAMGLNGLTPAISAPGLGSPLPHLCRDSAHSCHICAGTGLAPTPHLHRDPARLRLAACVACLCSLAAFMTKRLLLLEAAPCAGPVANTRVEVFGATALTVSRGISCCAGYCARVTCGSQGVLTALRKC
jgi:hypothetical protein